MNDVILTVEHITRRLSLEELVTVQGAIDKYASELVNATVNKIILWILHGTSQWTEDELLTFLKSLKEGDTSDECLDDAREEGAEE